MDAPEVRYAESTHGGGIPYVALGQGPPYVHLPNMEISQRMLDEMDDPTWRGLARIGEHFTVVVIDPRAEGVREPAALELATQVADVRAVADQLGFAEFALLGAVTSAPIAISVAAQFPERVTRLLLWNPVLRGADVRRDPRVEGIFHLLNTDWELFCEVYALRTLGFTESAAALAEQLRRVSSPATFRAAREALVRYDATSAARRVACPTLVMHRRRNRRVTADLVRETAATIKNARLLTLEGEHAAMFWEAPEIAADAVLAFLHGSTQSAGRSPSQGFRTLMFTDLAASTATTQRIGDAAAQDFVRAHNKIVRDALTDHAGHEIKHTGDGIMAWFPAASNALDCAQAIQQAVADLANPDLGVKIGCNAGEPIAEEDDLYGTAVQIAARVTDQAQAGEVVCTNVVRELVAGKGYLFSEREAAALKGVEEPVRLFTLRADA